MKEQYIVLTCRKLVVEKLVLRSQSEYSSDPKFPKARALKYSAERGQAYLLCSEWVQELPCRYGRYTLTLMKGMSQGPDSNRNGIALQAIAQPLRHLGNQRSSNDKITYKTFHLDHVLAVHISDIVWNQQGRLGTSGQQPRTEHLVALMLTSRPYQTGLLPELLKQSLFRLDFELRCFQLLFLSAQLLGNALSDNRSTSGAVARFLSY